MKNVTKGIISIGAGVAMTVAGIIITAISKKSTNENTEYLENTDSEDTYVEVED